MSVPHIGLYSMVEGQDWKQAKYWGEAVVGVFGAAVVVANIKLLLLLLPWLLAGGKKGLPLLPAGLCWGRKGLPLLLDCRDENICCGRAKARLIKIAIKTIKSTY